MVSFNVLMIWIQEVLVFKFFPFGLLKVWCSQQTFALSHRSLPPTHPYYNSLSEVKLRPHMFTHSFSPGFWVKMILYWVYFHSITPLLNKSWHITDGCRALLLLQSRSVTSYANRWQWVSDFSLICGWSFPHTFRETHCWMQTSIDC